MEEIEEWVYYDEGSPTYLRWKKDRYVGKNWNIHRWIKDSPAGKSGCRRVTLMLGNKHYSVHHIVWWLFHKQVPQKGQCIDHIDGNPFNNHIKNLRLVSQAVNSRNLKKSAANTSGCTGVSLHQGNYWKVSWYEGGKMKCKYFKGADEESFLKAVEFRKMKIDELNSKNYGYTERHGK